MLYKRSIGYNKQYYLKEIICIVLLYLDENERALERLKNSAISAIDLGSWRHQYVGRISQGAIPRLTHT
jgi:hypothetical protein